MHRRTFLSTPAALATKTSTQNPVRMKLGCQSAPSTEDHFKYFARYGVRNVCAYPDTEGRLYATIDELKRLTDLGSKYGISIDCVAPPFLTSSHIDREK